MNEINRGENDARIKDTVVIKDCLKHKLVRGQGAGVHSTFPCLAIVSEMKLILKRTIRRMNHLTLQQGGDLRA